jgi:hypothetical protein
MDHVAHTGFLSPFYLVATPAAITNRYGLPLHLCREMGFHVRSFDLFNERSFSLDEVEELARLLFGDAQVTHSVHRDFRGFCADVTQAMAPPCLCPVKLKRRPWIDARKLKQSIDGGNQHTNQSWHSLFALLKTSSSWSLNQSSKIGR